MIARTWTGRTRRSDADAYLEYIVATGLADFRKAAGNQGVWIWRRDDGHVTEFRVVSLWDSMAAIEQEVGSDITRARYYREDARYLLELEPTVTHFEVAHSASTREG